MSLTFKLLSLAIRTAAKPIGNYIKRQAKEHDGFRRFAIRQAQRVHQVDMRMRLGILHDADAQQRMHEREQKAAEERKRKTEVPTVRSEEEQRKHLEEQARLEKEGEQGRKKEEKPPKVKIRPLSEAKAIELGANFFSEAFIFAVAAGLLVWDSWRSRKKESARRDDVAERLEELETEVNRLRTRYEPQLEAMVERPRPEKTYSWYNPAGWWKTTEPLDGGEVPVGGEETKIIPGSVPHAAPDKAVKPTAQTATKASELSTGPKDVERPVTRTTGNSPVSGSKATPEAPPMRVDSAPGTKRER